MSKAVWGFI